VGLDFDIYGVAAGNWNLSRMSSNESLKNGKELLP
jgi:hypothetical protein